MVLLLKSNTSRAPAKVSCTVYMNTSSKRPVDLRIIRSISPITTYISSPDFSSCSMYVPDNSYVDEAFKSLNNGDLRSTFVIELVQGRGTQNDVTKARLGQTLDPSPRDTFEAKKRVFRRRKKGFLEFSSTLKALSRFLYILNY